MLGNALSYSVCRFIQNWKFVPMNYKYVVTNYYTINELDTF